jgi:transposase
MKAIPGRKTDSKDSEWLADLLRHGLLKASFIPPAPIRELRDLSRYRKSLVQERAREVNRVRHPYWKPPM